MKNILKLTFVLLMIFTNKNLSAQPGGNAVPTLVPCSYYNPNPEMDKFVGTWKWISGNESFEMILKKDKSHDIFDENTCEDIIYGFHEYKKNGVVLETSLQYVNTDFIQGKNSISSWSIVIDSNELRGGIINISKYNNRIKFKFKFIDVNHLEIVSLENYEGMRVYLPGQTIPTDITINLPSGIILTKQ